jgi:hypothetical protein
MPLIVDQLMIEFREAGAVLGTGAAEFKVWRHSNSGGKFRAPRNTPFSLIFPDEIPNDPARPAIKSSKA